MYFKRRPLKLRIHAGQTGAQIRFNTCWTNRSSDKVQATYTCWTNRSSDKVQSESIEYNTLCIILHLHIIRDWISNQRMKVC